MKAQPICQRQKKAVGELQATRDHISIHACDRPPQVSRHACGYAWRDMSQDNGGRSFVNAGLMCHRHGLLEPGFLTLTVSHETLALKAPKDAQRELLT